MNISSLGDKTIVSLGYKGDNFMKNNSVNKQASREKTDVPAMNPQKSADPPQPQGKSNSKHQNKNNNNINN